jgi:hypothetical protein
VPSPCLGVLDKHVLAMSPRYPAYIVAPVACLEKERHEKTVPVAQLGSPGSILASLQVVMQELGSCNRQGRRTSIKLVDRTLSVTDLLRGDSDKDVSGGEDVGSNSTFKTLDP